MPSAGAASNEMPSSEMSGGISSGDSDAAPASSDRPASLSSSTMPDVSGRGGSSPSAPSTRSMSTSGSGMSGTAEASDSSAMSDKSPKSLKSPSSLKSFSPSRPSKLSKSTKSFKSGAPSPSPAPLSILSKLFSSLNLFLSPYMAAQAFAVPKKLLRLSVV